MPALQRFLTRSLHSVWIRPTVLGTGTLEPQALR
jgi:hypothetical protein